MGLCFPGRAAIGIGLAAALTAGAVALRLEARPTPAPSTVAESDIFTLVDEYCLSCHDDDKEKGDLSLEKVAALDVGRHPEIWEKVVRKLRARQMPPVGKRRPPERTYDSVVAFLETRLDRAARARPNPGRAATIRRLTRTE
ncbi:MAG: c-type cytochrome domain-containing protein [Burkholderiales bacterium]